MLRRVSHFLLLFCIFTFFLSFTSDALGSKPVISQLKTGESSFASREYVGLYNNSDQEVDVSG